MPDKRRGQARKPAKGKDLVITRVFDAPRERVWRAWTDSEEAKRWWGPKGYTSPVAKMDLRIGGKFVNCMVSPEGKEYWGTGVFREIVPLERLVFTDSFADREGNVVPATHYGMSPDFPLEMLITVTFEDLGGKTKLTLVHSGLPAGPDQEGAGVGWNESFDKLAESLERSARGEAAGGGRNVLRVTLPSPKEILMTREFDAPRERVWRAITDRRTIPEWWGPARYTTTVDKMDVRPGGAWRYVSRGAGGEEHAFRGAYREVKALERLVSTFEYEGMPGHVDVETFTLEELPGGRTRLTVRAVFDSVEERDGMLKSGMESGAAESYDRLEAYLKRTGR